MVEILREMTPSKTLFYLCISFVAGISLQSAVKIPQMFLWGILIMGLSTIVVSFLFSGNSLATVGFCILFLALGIARFQISEFNAANDKIRQFNDSPEKVVLTGQIADESDVRDVSQKLKVKVDGSRSVVLVTTNRYPEYKYLDAVKVAGKLKTPKIFEDFNYKNYLMKDGIYSVMDFPEIGLISDKRNYNILSFAYEKVLFLKKKIKESINFSFSPPHSFLLSGIILGDDKNMSADLKGKLSATGLSHLTALSGSNVVILTIILTAFLLSLGMWRGQAFYFSVAFAWLYVLIAGLPASGIRAAIMATIFLLAEKLGKQKAAGRVIVLAAALMLLQNPFLLPYDIGFQLSFLASLGIIYLKPLIDDLFIFASKIFEKIKQNKKESRYRNLQSFTIYGIKENGPKRPKNDFFERLIKLRDIFSVTIAAQIFTLPVIAYNFKRLSLVSPLANLLIVPIVDWIMILGFLAVAAGMFSNLVGIILSFPCQFLLDYFLWTANFLARTWSSKNIAGFSPIWIFLYYLILVSFIIFLQKRKKPKFLEY